MWPMLHAGASSFLTVMPPPHIAPLSESNFQDALDIVQEALPELNASAELLIRRSVLAPGYLPELALVASCDAECCGYMQAFPPIAGRSDGYITLFAVSQHCRRRGIATALFYEAEARLKQLGATRVFIAPYGPAYWIPGPEPVRHTAATQLLEKRGYRVCSRPLAMRTALTSETSPRFSAGVFCSPFCASDVFDIQELMAEFSEDWKQIVLRTMEEILRGLRPAGELMLARFNSRVVGFAHVEGSRFGPFGIRAELRGKGFGSVLLTESLREMHQRGHNEAWFMWTGDATAIHVYTPCGFTETHRWAVFVKEISG